MDKTLTVRKARELAAEVAENLGYELVHVEISGAAKEPTLAVFIDRPEGINHDDCSSVSSELGELLDSEDFDSGNYVLEVSSPGIERGLYAITDFIRFAGELAKIKTAQPINGQRNFRGTLLGVADGKVMFDDRTNGKVEIPHSEIRKARLEVDLTGELKDSKGRF